MYVKLTKKLVLHRAVNTVDFRHSHCGYQPLWLDGSVIFHRKEAT